MRSHINLKKILFVLFLTIAISPDFLSGQTNPDPMRYASEINAFKSWDKKNSFPKDAILFVGSSSIRMWPTRESFPELDVINRGFGGAHISDVNYFIKNIVFKYRPKLIFFYAGDNDIADGKSIGTVVDDFKQFVKMTEHILPEVKIVFLPVKPSLSRWGFWQQMDEVNKEIKQWADENSLLFYLDTASPMLNENGTPKTDIFREDGLHMNLKGYMIWNKIVEKFLETEKKK